MRRIKGNSVWLLPLIRRIRVIRVKKTEPTLPYHIS
jgi:hypothetical protein